MIAKQQVGTVTLTEALDCRIEYETAAWFSVVRVAPGTYPVLAAFSSREARTPFSFILDAEGVCVEHHTPTLWGGVQVGRDQTSSREIGKTMRAGRLPGRINIESIDLLPGFRLDTEFYPTVMRERDA